MISRWLGVVALSLAVAACSSDATDSTSSEISGALQCPGVQKTQRRSGQCSACNCGLASAAMMRYAMTSCGSEVSSHSAEEMRALYNGWLFGSKVEEDGHCDLKLHPSDPDKCVGTWYTDIGNFLRDVHQLDDGPSFAQTCDESSSNCTSRVGAPGMRQDAFESLFAKGYVAAVIGEHFKENGAWVGSPCYAGDLFHFIFVYGYDQATDQFVVFDPVCGGGAGSKTMDAKRFFRWALHGSVQDSGECALGKDCHIMKFVYGRGEQQSQSPPPKCTPTTTCAGKCGAVDDGCGNDLHCGGCGAPETCGGGGTKNVCGHNADDDFPVASWMTGTLSQGGLCAQRLRSGAITMQACSPTNLNQNWSITASRQLMNQKDKDCAEPSTNASGALVSAKACAEVSSQEWSFRRMEIVNAQSGKCLNVAGAEYTDGNAITYRECSGKLNQRFNYNASFLKPSGAPDLCLEGSATDGTNVILRPCALRASEEWNDTSGGFVNQAAGLCLSVDGGASAEDGAKAQVSTCGGVSADRMWAMRGTIASSAGRTLCLRASAEGGQVTTAPCDENDDAQLFTYWMNF